MKLSALSAFAAALHHVLGTQPDVSSTLQNILDNTDRSNLYTYPTDLTRGIIPKGIHSHNDYWRDIPFYTALSAGCTSIEADVWLLNDTLYVGHELGALTPARTFASLYIKPLLSVLARQNPVSPFVPTATTNGVFDTSAGQTLYLFVDVKTNGESTWPAVLAALEPLRQAGYLSSISPASPTVSSAPVTVIGTGNTPLDRIAPLASRDVFFDAFLPNLTLPLAEYNITLLISPIASTDFAAVFGTVASVDGVLNSTQMDTLKTQVDAAHEKGILVRYWDLPGWPISLRNGVWRTLYDAGVDFINADDVLAAGGFSDESNYW